MPRERWVHDDCIMKVVNSYKYLGICFSTRLSFYHACQDLVSRAKKAVLCLMSKLYSLYFILKIFDAQVQPIDLYGTEIWGLESSSSVIDNVHLFGLKRYLGVDRRTPNNLGYGEVERFPVQINTSVRCVRYWLKLPIVYVCVRLLIRVSPSVCLCLSLSLSLSVYLSVCFSVCL